MISKEDFNKLFNLLTANRWDFPLKTAHEIKQTKSLYYSNLKGYDGKALKAAFEEVIGCKMQKAFPSLGRIRTSLDITKPFRTPVRMPLPRNIPKNRRDRITDLVRSARKIITTFGNDKEKLEAVVDRFKDGM